MPWKPITTTEYFGRFTTHKCVSKGAMHGGGEYWEYARPEGDPRFPELRVENKDGGRDSQECFAWEDSR